MNLRRWPVSLATLLAVSMLSACAAEQGPDSQSDLEPITPAPRFDGDPGNHAVFALDLSQWELATSEAEMDCFWDSGARHIVSGTQDRDITRQQLAMAVRRGMTVDAYVYIYWDGNTAAQVQEAFDRVDGFPIGRMWLDLEESPHGLGAHAIVSQIQQALDACRSHGGVDCGIYTGSGFWNDATANTTQFADVPLWYAHYDRRTSLSDWPSERFGGWTHGVAKQFSDRGLCGVGADLNVMQVLTTPTTVIDRSTPPDTSAPPTVPANLYPYDGLVTLDPDVKLLADTVPGATNYQFAVESWNGRAFVTYYTWTPVNPFVKVSLPSAPDIYRFRVRARRADVWSDWSNASSFDVGHYTGPRPTSSTPPPPAPPPSMPPPSDPPPPAPSPSPSPSPAPAPAPAGAPTNLAPDGITVTTASVTMTFSAVSGASSYDIDVEYLSGGTFVTYFDYTSSTNSKTFWPQTHHTSYRFRVRAVVAGTPGPYSSYATFQVP